MPCAALTSFFYLVTSSLFFLTLICYLFSIPCLSSLLRSFLGRGRWRVEGGGRKRILLSCSTSHLAEGKCGEGILPFLHYFTLVLCVVHIPKCPLGLHTRTKVHTVRPRSFHLPTVVAQLMIGDNKVCSWLHIHDYVPVVGGRQKWRDDELITTMTVWTSLLSSAFWPNALVLFVLLCFFSILYCSYSFNCAFNRYVQLCIVLLMCLSHLFTLYDLHHS